MNSWLDLLGKSEQKTRKHWLYLTIAHSCYIPVACLIIVIMGILQQGCAVFLLGIPLLMGFLVAIPLGMFWHCAYKNPGTRLLTFSIVMGPIRLLLSLGNFTRIIYPIEIPCALFEICFYLYWYVMTIKVRKINKTIQEQPKIIRCESNP